MKFWHYIVIAAFLFVCMYDPKSGGLEHYLTPGGRAGSAGDRSCCDESPVDRKCNSLHYQAVQFAEPRMGCPNDTTKARGGAIFDR